jgi:hypothetical protein
MFCFITLIRALKSSAHLSLRRLLGSFAACLLAGCAAQENSDPFEGRYRFSDPNERGYYVITRVGPGKWNASTSLDGKELIEKDAPMVIAPRANIDIWFDSASPRQQIVCLQSWSAYPSPFVCRVPVNVAFQVQDAMSTSSRAKSATGYVLVVGTPAGTIAADLLRER